MSLFFISMPQDLSNGILTTQFVSQLLPSLFSYKFKTPMRLESHKKNHLQMLQTQQFHHFLSISHAYVESFSFSFLHIFLQGWIFCKNFIYLMFSYVLLGFIMVEIAKPLLDKSH